jgi:hypothetical protein
LERRSSVRDWRSWNWRRIRWIALLIVLIWFGVGVYLAGQNSPPLPPAQNIFIKNCMIRGNRISTRSWSFSCKNAQISPDGILATIDGVHDGILYKNGKPYLSIAAQHVSVNTQSFDFTATGDVHVVALHPKDGISKSFDTDLVQWVNAAKMLQLPHPSVFTTGGKALKVAAITVDFNKDQVRLGNVNGNVEAPPP